MSTPHDTNFMQQFGAILLSENYPIIPIPPRSKAPILKGWPKIKATEDLVARWSEAAQGVGIITGDLVGVDIDVDDPYLADEFTKYCELLFGGFPVRRSQNGRALIVLRAKEPRAKRVSAKVKNLDGFPGDAPKLELLGVGQQFVAYGIHEKTGQPYYWEGCPLHEWGYFDIPIVDSDDLTGLLDYFETLCEEHGYEVTGSRSGVPVFTGDPISALEALKPPLDISDDHVALTLSTMHASDCDYDEWLQVGMALHHQYEGGNKSLEIWREWSQQSDKYDQVTTDKKWASFHDVRGSLVTFATLIQKSGVNLVGEDPLGEALTHYVYVGEGDAVADLRQLPHNAVRKIAEFKNLVANVRVQVDGVVKGKKVSKMTPVCALWLVHPARKTAVRRGYDPGQARLFTKDRQSHYNTFSFPFHEQGGEPGVKIGVFINHMTYLFPVEREREWFLDWLAHAVQRPWERPQVTPLHVSRLHGTGRGMVVRTIQKLFGLWNCKKTTVSDLVEGLYNEYLHESLFVFIDETKEAGKAQYEVSDKVRDKLTENVLLINAKYGFKGTSRVFSRIFMMSNHYDALRIPPEDRRVNVFDGPDALQDGEYFTRYVSWLSDDTAVAQLFAWLGARDLAAWDMQRSMNTPARARMIDYGRNETERCFFELLENPPRDIMTYREVCDALDSWDGVDPMGEGIRHKQVLKLLQEQCSPYGQIKINGKRERPWNLKPSVEHSNQEIREIMTGTKVKPTEKVTAFPKVIDNEKVPHKK